MKRHKQVFKKHPKWRGGDHISDPLIGHLKLNSVHFHWSSQVPMIWFCLLTPFQIGIQGGGISKGLLVFHVNQQSLRYAIAHLNKFKLPNLNRGLQNRLNKHLSLKSTFQLYRISLPICPWWILRGYWLVPGCGAFLTGLQQFILPHVEWHSPPREA